MEKCKVCGLDYMSSRESKKEHDKFHKQAVGGRKGQTLVRAAPLITHDDVKIYYVEHFSPMRLRRLVFEVGRYLKKENHYDFPPYEPHEASMYSLHAFLVGIDDKAIGLAI